MALSRNAMNEVAAEPDVSAEILHISRKSGRTGVSNNPWVRPAEVWIGSGLIGAALCWWVVADHFAMSGLADAYLALGLNRIASHNAVLNHAIDIASEAYILTGALLVALVWHCWFADDATTARERLLLGITGVVIAGVSSRLLQVLLPMRARPMHSLVLGFQTLPGIDPELANHWGSFPSDHAALFFALVAVIGQRSRGLGLLALLSALYGCLPRIYLGLHYPSDIVAGAAFGMAFVVLFERFGPRRMAGLCIAWARRAPGLFYAAAFLVTFEVATLFEDVRQISRGIPAVLRQLAM